MKVGRNDPCPCGSGRKYKHCCYAKDSVKHEPAEPEQTEQAAPAEDEEPEEDTQAADEALTHVHKKDRSRFSGQNRSKSSSFRPRASRGGQRGS